MILEYTLLNKINTTLLTNKIHHKQQVGKLNLTMIELILTQSPKVCSKHYSIKKIYEQEWTSTN